MKFDWMAQWSVLVARIDALSLRERGILFLAVMVGAASVANMLWLSPAQEAYAELTARFAKQGTELQRAREALSPTAIPLDTTAGVREEIARVKAQLKEATQKVQSVLPTAAQDSALTQVLVHLLRRHEGLTLVSTVALPPVADVAAALPAAGASAAAAPVVLMRQGVSLTVSGAYPELTRYVLTLEQALPYVRWGAMRLRSDKSPPELTLQLFLFGMKP